MKLRYFDSILILSSLVLVASCGKSTGSLGAKNTDTRDSFMKSRYIEAWCETTDMVSEGKWDVVVGAPQETPEKLSVLVTFTNGTTETLDSITKSKNEDLLDYQGGESVLSIDLSNKGEPYKVKGILKLDAESEPRPVSCLVEE